MLRSSTLITALLVTLPASAQDVPEPPREAFDLAAAIADGPPLTAARAAELAVESAPSLERARALNRAAEAQVSQARAAMLPRLELNASYQHVDGFPDGQISLGGDPAALDAARMLAGTVSDPAARALWLGSIESQSGGASIVIPRDRISFSARLTWPVSDFFFAVLPAVDAAEAGVRAREREQEAAAAGVRRSAREAYYTLARARGALAVTQEAGRQARAQLAQVEAGVRAGYLTEADRLMAESRVAEIDQAATSAQAGVEMADAGLRALLGQSGDVPYGVVLDEVPEAVAADEEAALAARPELAALRAALTAQRAAARVEDARGYPHVAVFAGGMVANPSPYQIPPQQVFTPSWELGAALTWAPNDTLSAFHRGEQLGAEQAAVEAQIEQLERMVRLEVSQAASQARAARQGIEAARVAEQAALAAYEARLSQVRAGEATTAELFAAEGQLNRARLATLDAEVSLRIAATRVAYAAGAL
ncbi:MAG: TolC family protein [Sandaracinaceae bacterium]|nr:TolC family protein [Sandaracinaceae bacterium]